MPLLAKRYRFAGVIGKGQSSISIKAVVSTFVFFSPTLILFDIQKVMAILGVLHFPEIDGTQHRFHAFKLNCLSVLFLIFQDVYCDDKLVAIKVLHQHNYTLGFQESDCIRRLNTADPFCLSPTFRMHVSRTKLSSVIGSLYLRANFPVVVPVMLISCAHIPYIINGEELTFILEYLLLRWALLHGV